MNEEKQVLNRVYKELSFNAHSLMSALNSGGYECEFGYSLYHSGDGGENEYPLPIISVNHLCNVVIDLDYTMVEMEYKKKKLLNMNVEGLAKSHRIEIYSCEDEAEIVFSPKDNVSELLSRIIGTVSERFRLCVYLPGKADFNDLRKTICELNVTEGEK